MSKADVADSGEGNRVTTVVNGDAAYDARTTRRALALLFGRYNVRFGQLELKQWVDVPIGCGFGASAASAISAVSATASALGLRATKAELAGLAHAAEIKEQTGLGTVSVTYEATGAGAITSPGIPGVARFLNVKIPDGVRLVAASLAPYEKRDVLSSPETRRRIVTLGDEALRRVVAAPSWEELAVAGEWFSEKLGLESSTVQTLIRTAKSAGADHASQNMIGHAIHALVDENRVEEVAAALKSSQFRPRVDVFEVGSVKAGLL